MRAAIGIAAGALLLVSSTTAFAQSPAATAELKTADGKSVGMATFTQESGGVRLKVQGVGMPPGDHGIHVHAVGKCDAPDFMTAGGHFNPGNKQHGLNNPQGAHAGDMPNLKVNADGTAAFDALLKDASTASGAGSLFGPEGTALVIHAGADDGMTDPSGNSGGRIACGVIMRAAGTAAAAPAAQPSPAAKPAGPAPAASPAPVTKPAAPAQAPAAAKPSVAASPAALPRTGIAGAPIDLAIPAAATGLGAIVAGLAIWRRRR
ncbi:MAG: superoxide dismutase family protein [Chloroflexi bacterium]|nr:superoxide dismutase family protein [Chloroflexota bacterium]